MNKYRLWYNRLMAQAVIRDLLGQVPATEQHYVTPATLGGTPTQGNTVLLTLREKLLANRLLAKFVKQP